ncbi:MAG: fimbria major subunit [Muribaculaceae bacterium]|nr:fimbria major subunit [Muribaculaceae bacterium]
MRTTYLYGTLALGLLLAGCSSDEINDLGGNGVADKEQTLYVNMNIRGDIAGTRAAEDDGKPVNGTDFDSGTGESEISNAYFVFYDAQGNNVGDVVNVTLNNPVTSATGATIEKYYQSVVPVSLQKGQNKPTQVVCYINPITPAELNSPLHLIETVTRTNLYSTGTDGKKYFAMSNSVYYPDENTNTKPRIAVPVEENQLHSSQQSAQDALEAGNGVVDIYVERYASKLNFKVETSTAYEASTSLINNTEEVPVTLTFVPERWALNAACRSSYVVKSFRKDLPDGGSAIAGDNYTFSEMDARVNAESITGDSDGTPVYGSIISAANKWSWNNASYHRSFWGVSPAFFSTEYPEVSGDVTPQMQTSQYYWSFNQLANGAGYAADDESSHYFHTTTVGARALLSKNPAAAVASVIYVGRYVLSLNGTELPAETTFYTYLKGNNGNARVYFEGAGAQGNSTVNGGESMLRRFIEQASCLFKYDEDSNEYIRFDITKPADVTKLVSIVEIAEPSEEVKDGLKLSERYRTLQFKKGANFDGVFVAVNNGYQKIGATTDADAGTIDLLLANKTLMGNVGYAVKYETGAGYFNIPVKHYGWYRPGNLQKEDNKIDWNQVRIGDFGLVRNHAYSINVTNILGIATGIGGLDNPIVPPADTNDFFVAYRVNILKWALLPTQDVEL